MTSDAARLLGKLGRKAQEKKTTPEQYREWGRRGGFAARGKSGRKPKASKRNQSKRTNPTG